MYLKNSNIPKGIGGNSSVGRELTPVQQSETKDKHSTPNTTPVMLLITKNR